ncbi:hypothetical protein Syun_030604 [Stephania yunnanensis]|uniref:Uncharacterized protein n=1 Tax=Stephania yunnanensis TaxID=152371 RepID=A0AAP0HDZ9_9MAGN
MAPVLICKDTLTTMVKTIIDNEARFAKTSDWLMFTAEGIKKAIEMHMREVPHSLDSWSLALGIEVVPSWIPTWFAQHWSPSKLRRQGVNLVDLLSIGAFRRREFTILVTRSDLWKEERDLAKTKPDLWRKDKICEEKNQI